MRYPRRVRVRVRSSSHLDALWRGKMSGVQAPLQPLSPRLTISASAPPTTSALASKHRQPQLGSRVMFALSRRTFLIAGFAIAHSPPQLLTT